MWRTDWIDSAGGCVLVLEDGAMRTGAVDGPEDVEGFIGDGVGTLAETLRLCFCTGAVGFEGGGVPATV